MQRTANGHWRDTMKTYELQSRIRSNCFSSTIYCYLRNLTSPAPDSYIVSFVVVFSNVTFRKYVSQRETQISSKLFHAVEEKNLTYVASTRFKNLFLSFHEKCLMFPRTLFFFIVPNDFAFSSQVHNIVFYENVSRICGCLRP